MSPRRARTAIRAIPAEPAVTRLLTRARSCALVLGVAAAAAVAVPASAFASAGASTVVGHVYVNDNTTGTNTIGAFDRHADGSLTPEAGSPFVAGGAGTGSGLASQGALQLSAGGRFLIAVDAGSNQVSVLRIRPGGSLRLVSHGVVSSGGLLPAAPGSPFPAEGAGPFGSQFRPADPGQLFVSNAHNTQPDSGTVSAFTAKLRRRG